MLTQPFCRMREWIAVRFSWRPVWRPRLAVSLWVLLPIILSLKRQVWGLMPSSLMVWFLVWDTLGKSLWPRCSARACCLSYSACSKSVSGSSTRFLTLYVLAFQRVLVCS
ncbi:Uncharacterised protein [Vibrio cholerae]|nr:Uncharacterised protein [Vibrio cholerae]